MNHARFNEGIPKASTGENSSTRPSEKTEKGEPDYSAYWGEGCHGDESVPSLASKPRPPTAMGATEPADPSPIPSQIQTAGGSGQLCPRDLGSALLAFGLGFCPASRSLQMGLCRAWVE
jgi:hypothetical protein